MSTAENAVLLALVAIIPLVLLTLTSFVKLSVVLSLVRNAIGAPDAPSGLVVTGLSLVLTFFVMAPVAVQMAQAAATPDGPQAPAPVPAPAPAPEPKPASIDEVMRRLVPAQYQPQVAAAERALVPLKSFLAKHTRDADRDTFVALSQKLGNDTKGDELWVQAPAFITTELREAFAIALLIFIPFLVIDLIVALGLASLGLQSTSPSNIALPLKLALFVAVDGWRLLLDSLLRGYV
ncbi:MAG TPA: flagellar type III secretion system pore protein FliP [Kofleriaceae bacterium]|nr:flagellar type III secretion system pore protein FliP [Kofleriaceae bacterium]